MTHIVRTSPVRDLRGKVVTDPRKIRRLRAHGRIREVDPRQVCRVCGGTHVSTHYFPAKEKGKWTKVEGFGECEWCDEDGYAKHVCGDCGEPLPCCACFNRCTNVRRELMELVEVEDGP